MSTALVPVETQQSATASMLMPLASATEAAAAIAAYERLKAAIVRPDDVQVIQGRKFLKKSFWRRVATCFGLSLELVREERIVQDGALAYRVMYRAIAPNGRTMDSDGYCSTAEAGRSGWPEHNVRATAHTRAKNRAISDLVGGGEVSAEEMPEDHERHTTARQSPQRASAALTPDQEKELRAEIAGFCHDLGIGVQEKAALWKKHNKNLMDIRNELARRWNEAQAIVDAAEDAISFEVEDTSLEDLEAARGGHH